MTPTKVEISSQASFLRRLAVVFADPLRLKIVTELYMREMSPTQFFEEFGGGSVPRVDRHFKTLTKHGWLRLVREASGGRRRGGVEHFYRAPELAIFGHDTWAQLPDSIKVAFSWRGFEQLAERVQEAIAAGTFDARSDRHLSATTVLFDQPGWDRAIAAVDAVFETAFEEQVDAKLRIAQSGEQPILATLALVGFESPMPTWDSKGGRRSCSTLPGSAPERKTSALVPTTLRLAKAFGDPLNLQIVTELSQRAMSPTQFHAEFGGAPMSGFHRRFKMLAEIGWLKRVEARTGGKRRGAIEHFYSATGPVIFAGPAWSDVPEPVKSTDSWRSFEQASEKIVEAIDAGTFDARPERHLSWSLLLLDQVGWRRVIDSVETLFASIRTEGDAAELRIAESGEESIPATIALAAFESPKDSARAL